MKKNLTKKLIAATMAVSVLAVCSSGAMAFDFGHGKYIKDASNTYADQIEAIVEEIGNEYEANAENYPGAAVEDPEAATQAYFDTVIELGNSFLSRIFGATQDYSGSVNDAFGTETAAE